jgi:hypothetical protein
MDGDVTCLSALAFPPIGGAPIDVGEAESAAQAWQSTLYKGAGKADAQGWGESFGLKIHSTGPLLAFEEKVADRIGLRGRA